MSVVKMRTRVRRRILIAGAMPVAIIGVPLSILLISQLRSIGHLEQASRQMLTQSAVRVAEVLASRIREDVALGALRYLRALPNVRIVNGDNETLARLAPRELGPALGPARVFVGGFAAGDERREAAVTLHGVAAPEGAGWSGSGEKAAVSAREPRRPTAEIRAKGPTTFLDPVVRSAVIAASGMEVSEFARVFHHDDGRPVFVAIRLLPRENMAPGEGRFVGLALDVGDLARSYFPRIVGQLRGADPLINARHPLEVAIVDDRRREVYRTGASLLEAHVHEALLPFEADGRSGMEGGTIGVATVAHWSVLAGYPGTDAAALARSSTNQQRQFLLLVSLVASVGIALTGRAIARERGVSELKAEFVSSISHDLKTPLASIQLLAENLPSLPSVDRVGRYAGVIGAEARKLGKLIDDILEFEKIAGGARMYTGTAIDLRDPLRHAMGEFAPQLRETGFRTEFVLPASSVLMVGDAAALTHAFSNVIGNAIKYSEDECHLRVELSLRHGNAVIEVHDRGRGIPPADRRKVFERFYRVRRDSGTDPAGTGLGLSITAHVVSSHGGRISVAGRPGGGSVFRIEIPLDAPRGGRRKEES